LNLAVVLRNPVSGKQHFARVKVPEGLPRIVSVDQVVDGIRPEEASDTAEGATFVTIEDVIGHHLDHLFPGMEVLEYHT
ncbi:hypothetical protein, partial [Streptococcus agalactiae]